MHSDIYIKREKSTKKKVSTVAIVRLGTVATIQNFKKNKKKDKVANQNGTVDEQ